MKLNQRTFLILLTAGMALAAWKGSAQTFDEQMNVARAALRADRKATIAKSMQLTEAEAKAFWPLYDQYSAEKQKQGDALLKLFKEYGQLYPNVSDDRARAMLKELGNLEKQRVETKNSYLRKIEKVVSPAKTLRFAQVESRLDLVLQLELAANVPLVPIEGRLTGEATGAAVVVGGVPGGGVVATYELTATVAALDKASRKVTLVDAAGIKKTVKAGPEVINFEQIQVGDQLKITATEELVVYVAGEGETPADGGAQLVALAPKGAKPGALMAETTRVTAKVTAIDSNQHKATLQFEDGTTRTVAVRPDVDLSKRKVGDSVVIRITEALAIQVAKP
jgi:Cu/Ag efflux protein CusF